MTSQEPKVFILMPIHNRRAISSKMASLINQQTWQKKILIVIDDGSTDGSAAEILHQYPEAKILQGNGGLWWAGSLNLGIKELARLHPEPDDVVLIINDDQEVDSLFIEKGVQELLSETNNLLLARAHHMDRDCPVPGEGGVNFDQRNLLFLEDDSNFNCFSTRALFLRYRDLHRIGSFRSTLLPHYLSDYEFTYRAFSMGYRLRLSREIKVRVHTHLTGPRTLRPIKGLRKKISMAFSPKYPGNPLYLTCFAVMTSRGLSRITNPVRVWSRFGAGALRGFLSHLGGSTN